MILLLAMPAYAQVEAGKDKRAFVFNPKSDANGGVNGAAGIIETLEVTYEAKFREDGTKYTEFLLESVVSGANSIGLGFPYNGDGATLPTGFSYVGNLGGGKTPQGVIDKLPQFICAHTGVANSMDCDALAYQGGGPNSDFTKSPLIANSKKGVKKDVFLETSYFIAYEPTKKTAHFRLRVDLDRLFAGETLISTAKFIPTNEIGVWYHPRASFLNLAQDLTTGRFTAFKSVHTGWYDTGKVTVVEYPGDTKCKDLTPEVFDFNDLKHGEIVTDQFKDYFTVTGFDLLGTQYKVVAFNSASVHPTLSALGTPAKPVGPGKAGDLPGHGNTEAKKIILVVTDGQDTNADGIIDGGWNPLAGGGIITFNFKKPTSVRSIVSINLGTHGQDVYRVGSVFHKIPNLGLNAVQTLNMDFPDNVSEDGKKMNDLMIQFHTIGGVDDLAICLDCLEKDRDQCGICNGPGKDTCGFCPDHPDYKKDTDGDGVYDCNESCPNDPDKTQPGECGCGKKEQKDNCGVCGGDGKDVCGLCKTDAGYGEGEDDCGLCYGDPGYKQPKDDCGLCPNQDGYQNSKNECGSCPGDVPQITKNICGECDGPGPDVCGRCQPDAKYGNPDCDPCPNDEIRDECKICGGDGKDDCNFCPQDEGYNKLDECKRCFGDPEYGKPCVVDCEKDICGDCDGGNKCCENQTYTEQQFLIDGGLHLMVNNFNTLRIRYLRRSKASNAKKIVRESAKKVNDAMLAGWTATWSIASVQTFCSNTIETCAEISNTSNIEQVTNSARSIEAETKKMYDKLSKAVGRKRKADRKIYQTMQRHLTERILPNIEKFPPKTQNCPL
ncbi:MAG: hypothetical protein R3A13_03365 [Bdellovibrionota bacterium]